MNEACEHRWRIEEPAGRTSEGVCSKCGAKRVYNNCQDDMPVRIRTKFVKRKDNRNTGYWVGPPPMMK